MEAEDDEELQLVRASGALLTDLELNLPKLLWKPSKTGASDEKRVHRYVRDDDLSFVVQMVSIP